MRRKLPVLILAVIILLQVFSPVVFAVSKNEPEIQTAYFCSSGLTSEGAGKAEVKALKNYYPPNNGALGDVQRKFLMPGEQIDRFGELGGRYFSPAGTPMQMRALPSNANLSQYRAFEVVKPFEVEKSVIAPAFNQIGLGTQFRSPVSAEILLKRGIIKPIP